MKRLIDHYHFEPQRLSAAGYAQYHPVAANDTPEGRARNRRVDIVILNPPALEPVADTPSTPSAQTSPAPAAPNSATPPQEE